MPGNHSRLPCLPRCTIRFVFCTSLTHRYWAKYLWGGKSFKGIDCSALVQVFLNYNNKFFPRDSGDQEKYLTKKIKLKNLRKNDIIFWKGHVAVALSNKKIIHAYGPMKKVVIMDIKKAIERIERTAKLKVTSIRRI